ncbi:prion-inhibition and propagation-domain-containing protein [Schizophyllum commune]
MEAAGLVVGVISLASLWEACMQVFDVVVTVQHYDWDCKLARVKLETEHVRLSAWGKAVGFVDLGRGWHSGTPQHSVGSPSRHAFPQHPRLRDPQVANIVWDNLGCMRHLFDKIRTLQRHHAMHHVGSSHSRSSDFSDGPLTTSCTPLHHRQSGRPGDSPQANTSKASITKRIRWAISDRHRFKELIAEIRWLNDSLCSLVPDVAIGARDNLQPYLGEDNDIEPLIGTLREEDVGKELSGRASELALKLEDLVAICSPSRLTRIVGDEVHWPYSPIGEENTQVRWYNIRISTVLTQFSEALHIAKDSPRHSQPSSRYAKRSSYLLEGPQRTKSASTRLGSYSRKGCARCR